MTSLRDIVDNSKRLYEYEREIKNSRRLYSLMRMNYQNIKIIQQNTKRLELF